MVKLDGIIEFIAVAETGSFTAAARRLKLSTAQVSRMISALEKRLSLTLFYRTTRRVSLTDEGNTYYHHCKQALEGLELAEQALGQLHVVPQGKIKVTAPHTFGELQIAPLLNDFVVAYPDIELEYELTNKQLDLIEGGYDLAIRVGQLEDSSLIAKRLGSRRLFVCASPEYLAIHGTPHSLSELKHHNCILGTLEYWRFEENGLERNIRVSGNLRCNSGPALLDAAMKGIGLVQLPDYYLADAISEGKLVTLLEKSQSAQEGIWAVYPSRNLSFRVRTLLEFLLEKMAAAP
ncbi:LysR substrate-binding domain-containing protein [Pseudomaricurvus sp. HS19]|uniref:LysR substrate-binding domain-containing protein n=1 Tax=Pseudomaricurvus sp. HS19 TaxID=2692626 RepID=UPI00136EFCC4|nr:LysR substrate-binding domain-containing protein [Pseudomaricurvus sp. HS19]MYM62814.1 LysR family transcriptional regulator [Pseudomaricurvus sp. HS19]